MLNKEQSSGQALKPRILIVDDEHDITFPWKLGLERLGFQVDTFNNPILAASNYQPNVYDLLLIDIRMPMMNGFELYKEIRKIDKKVKLCFITAYDINNEDFKKSFPTLTLRHFIKKPIRTQDLAKEIRQKLNEDFEIISSIKIILYLDSPLTLQPVLSSILVAGLDLVLLFSYKEGVVFWSWIYDTSGLPHIWHLT